MNRSLSAASWAEVGSPMLRDPRALVADLHRVHRPAPGTVVVGVLDQLGRVAAGASFPAAQGSQRPGGGDGWQYRNALLAHLRRIIPHDLRRPSPVRTAVLMLCRRGGRNWTAEDGAWMWALHDASTLHGLRCGAYVTLTDEGWQVLGDGRRGRTPHAGSWAHETVRTVSALPVRAIGGAVRAHGAPGAVRAGTR
ncbi:hypothetical protein [Streptacidiphilus sp. PB12-B1b]|uniref:hypothetical protein n=1 Tax=Streptacidiphilus sp. PB12-B1b TaxID=2705012 RepID=UPI001CDCC770|nr:hypothetical protein [Streptacidiphilus sp. PB12-B1b]